MHEFESKLHFYDAPEVRYRLDRDTIATQSCAPLACPAEALLSCTRNHRTSAKCRRTLRRASTTGSPNRIDPASCSSAWRPRCRNGPMLAYGAHPPNRELHHVPTPRWNPPIQARPLGKISIDAGVSPQPCTRRYRRLYGRTDPHEPLVVAINRSATTIPRICYHESLGSLQTCNPCFVVADGELKRACAVEPKAGVVVDTTADAAKHAREEAMQRILGNHELYCTICDFNNKHCEVHNATQLLQLRRERFRSKHRSVHARLLQRRARKRADVE